jgi:hypothetical protein
VRQINNHWIQPALGTTVARQALLWEPMLRTLTMPTWRSPPPSKRCHHFRVIVWASVPTFSLWGSPHPTLSPQGFPFPVFSFLNCAKCWSHKPIYWYFQRGLLHFFNLPHHCLFSFAFCFIYKFIPFVVVLWFEHRASHLQGKCSTTWAKPSALFCFSYFSDSISGFSWAWPQTVIFPPSSSQVARITRSALMLLR